MSKKSQVPPAPLEQVVIAQEDLSRLNAWLEFFQRLSPRIKLIKSPDKELKSVLANVESALRAVRAIDESYTLVGWPQETDILFVVAIDSSAPGSLVPQYNALEAYFFRLDNVAFTANHFDWDGDAEEEEWAESYSLGGFDKEDLTWVKMKSQIIRQISELETRVPELKKIDPPS